jgi:hypothetical protein
MTLTSPHLLGVPPCRDTEPLLVPFEVEEEDEDESEVTATVKRPVVDLNCDRFIKIR